MYRLAIVDDNELWCFVVALRLQQQGYVVSTFTNAHKFLRAAHQFDLVLVDFSIPTPRYQTTLDGSEIICQVKRFLPDPPLLVLISSYFTADLLEQASEICPEADAIFSKQLEAEKLIAQVKQLLVGRNPLNQGSGRTPFSRSSIAAEAPSYH